MPLAMSESRNTWAHTQIITLDPTPTVLLELSPRSTSPLTSLAWAPSCGRSYHLIATGARDGTVRIWRVEPPKTDLDINENGDLAGWEAECVADFGEGARIGMVDVRW